MTEKEMTLVLLEIRLLLITVRTVPRSIQQTYLVLAYFYSFLVTRGSAM